MPRKRAEYRNEVKTRLDDQTWSALQVYKRLHGIDHDSVALARLTKQSLLGVIGSIPDLIAPVSADSSERGKERAAA